MTIKIKKLNPAAILPTYAHGPDSDAGMDLYAVEDVKLYPNIPALVNTGVAIELPPGYEGQIRPRSGLALKHGITVFNAPATIDPSYRGEIGVILLCLNPAKAEFYNPKSPSDRIAVLAPYLIHAGDRIAQLVIAKYEPVEWDEADTELSDTVRGAGGFGSTGA